MLLRKWINFLFNFKIGTRLIRVVISFISFSDLAFSLYRSNIVTSPILSYILAFPVYFSVALSTIIIILGLMLLKCDSSSIESSGTIMLFYIKTILFPF